LPQVKVQIMRVVLNYETKSKRNERNETKRNETKRNITKRNEIYYVLASICIDSELCSHFRAFKIIIFFSLFSTILHLDFGTVPTVWYFAFRVIKKYMSTHNIYLKAGKSDNKFVFMTMRVVLNYETKSKRNERNETKRNETKYYGTQRNIHVRCSVNYGYYDGTVTDAYQRISKAGRVLSL
jgi:hypothetical protein